MNSNNSSHQFKFDRNRYRNNDDNDKDEEKGQDDDIDNKNQNQNNLRMSSEFQKDFTKTSNLNLINFQSKSKVLKSKAINLSSKFLNKSLNYLNSNEIDSNKINQSNHQHFFIQSKSNLNLSSLSKIQSFETYSSNQIIQSKNHHHHHHHSISNQSLSSLNLNQSKKSSVLNNSNHSNTTTTTTSSNYLSYLNLQYWQKKNHQNSSGSEDHLVCFPGIVALQSPSHTRAGDIQIHLSFHAFKTNQNLGDYNRSQKLFYSMICKLIGIRSSTPSNSHSHSHSNSTSTLNSNSNSDDSKSLQDFLGSDHEDDSNLIKFKPLIQSSNFSNLKQNHPPSTTSSSHLTSSCNTITTSQTSYHSSNLEPKNTAINSHAFNQPQNPSLSRFPSFSSLSSSQFNSDLESQPPLPSLNSLPHQSNQTRLENLNLSKLHFNLKDRLHSFFAQKSQVDIRLKLYGICSSQSINHHTHSHFKSRLSNSHSISSTSSDNEFLINNGRPLLTQVITTNPAGFWSDKLVLPWQTIESHLIIHQSQLNQKNNIIHSSKSKSPQLGITKLKIEAELVKQDDDPQKVQSSINSTSQKRISIGKSNLSITLDVIPAIAENIHVISDIDDTIKQTNVLTGLKEVLKNVFLAEFNQVEISGMADWYQALSSMGCWIHYISNSPLELWYPIEEFLSHAKFPFGSVSLKEYARGATSILSGLWESAGSRKRARVESIMKQFPRSKFICIGDSGEQDLEMYVSLAQAYPGRILSIYIRDVTTSLLIGNSGSINESTPVNKVISDSQIKSSSNNLGRFSFDVSSKSRNFSYDLHEKRSSIDTLEKLKKKVPVDERTQRPPAPIKPAHLIGTKLTSPPTLTKTPVVYPNSIHSLQSITSSNLINESKPFVVEKVLKTSSSTGTSNRLSQLNPTHNSSLSSLPSQNLLTPSPPIDDLRSQTSLESFHQRIKKAEMDLEQIEFKPKICDESFDQDDNEMIVTEKAFNDLENEDGYLIKTKLKLFKDSIEVQEDCLKEVESYLIFKSINSN
ncbi:hypothetical protein O181_036326 [Austropuccinia psidii MF-1]|uniref:Phosphatidate phosphatase APP1 catalytic domain-containing protein n=1 Tax=Austropuccinia psidii MF-1 TaxID=1389203 RepID=A0A9Q3DA10_9BASI|nr:hypothetical protein [Austropuccinia psidii MF-1]